MELTSDEESIEKMGKNEYLKNKMVNMSKYALTLKLVDRLANILDTPKQKYIQDTLVLVSYIRENREELNNTQESIIKDIIIACEENLK
jgi:flagellar basal body-associated protein FliL